MPEPEAIAGSGAETGVTHPAPGAGAHPAAAPQRSRRPCSASKRRPSGTAINKRQSCRFTIPNPRLHGRRPKSLLRHLPRGTPPGGISRQGGRSADSPANRQLRNRHPALPALGSPAPRMFAGMGDEVSCVCGVRAVASGAVPDTGDDDEEPDFEERLPLQERGMPNNGAVLGEVINHDKQTLADDCAAARHGSELPQRARHRPFEARHRHQRQVP